MLAIVFILVLCTTYASSQRTPPPPNNNSNMMPMPMPMPMPMIPPGSEKYEKYETNLLTDIIGNYSNGMRPVKSSKVPAIVQFDLRLKKLVKLDMKEQVLVMEAFVLMRWTDPQVQWNKSAYNETDIVNIPIKDIWIPDIELYNNAKDTSSSTLFKAPVIATSDGKIVWTNQVTLYGSCDVDITWFPLDVQKCSLTFGSWSYSHKRLKIQLYKQLITEYADMKAGGMFVSNGVWVFKKNYTTLSLQNYSCCPEPFSQIEYTFELKRRPTFFLLYLIFPCIAIIILSLLTFVIPPEAGERIGFGVTVILSFSVYLIVISDKLPEKSDKSPLLGILYVLVFYILVFSFVISTINARLHFNAHRPPDWLLNLARGSKRKWWLTLGKKVRKTKVQAFNEQEFEEKKTESFDVQDMEEEWKKPERTIPDEELYKKQWHNISGYLDILCLKIVLALVAITPLIVVKMLEKTSKNH